MKDDPEQFAYWLQGFFELAEPKTLNERQVAIIKEHLDLCFSKVTFTSGYSQPEPTTMNCLSGAGCFENGYNPLTTIYEYAIRDNPKYC
jgi:hypothetical protein